MGAERRIATRNDAIVLYMKDLEILRIEQMVVCALIERVKLRAGLEGSAHVAEKATA